MIFFIFLKVRTWCIWIGNMQVQWCTNKLDWCMHNGGSCFHSCSECKMKVVCKSSDKSLGIWVIPSNKMVAWPLNLQVHCELSWKDLKQVLSVRFVVSKTRSCDLIKLQGKLAGKIASVCNMRNRMFGHVFGSVDQQILTNFISLPQDKAEVYHALLHSSLKFIQSTHHTSHIQPYRLRHIMSCNCSLLILISLLHQKQRLRKV